MNKIILGIPAQNTNKGNGVFLRELINFESALENCVWDGNFQNKTKKIYRVEVGI